MREPAWRSISTDRLMCLQLLLAQMPDLLVKPPGGVLAKRADISSNRGITKRAAEQHRWHIEQPTARKKSDGESTKPPPETSSPSIAESSHQIGLTAWSDPPSFRQTLLQQRSRIHNMGSGHRGVPLESAVEGSLGGSRSGPERHTGKRSRDPRYTTIRDATPPPPGVHRIDQPAPANLGCARR